MKAKLSTTNIKAATPWKAAGLIVEVVKLPCSPRCAVETDDTPRARQLLEDFERGRLLDIPPRILFQAFNDLLTECKSIQQGRVAGVRI